MKYRPILELTLAKVRGLLREPEAIFWVFVFPLLLALALGVAFRSSGPEDIPVAVQQAAGAEWARNALEQAPGLTPQLVGPADARERLRRGEVALVVIPGAGGGFTYWYDPTRVEGGIAVRAVNDALQRAAGRAEPRPTELREMRERGSRYIDFLVPGLLGMNLMGTGMWGIGFAIVQARSKRLLKRLVATPMRRSHFLLAQMLGRLAFLVLEVGVLLLFAVLVLQVPLRGSVIGLCLVAALGALTFSGVGLLVASRAETIEGVQGLMNLVMLPMWILSGIFFSTARFPDVVQPLVQLLPLTAINDALRAVMLDGSPLTAIGGELAIMTGWGLATFGAALALFRWR